MLDVKLIELDILASIAGNMGQEELTPEILASIADMTPEDAFDRYCTWKGLVDWGPNLRRTLAILQKAEVAAQPDEFPEFVECDPGGNWWLPGEGRGRRGENERVRYARVGGKPYAK